MKIFSVELLSKFPGNISAHAHSPEFVTLPNLAPSQKAVLNILSNHNLNFQPLAIYIHEDRKLGEILVDK